jgi:hypothetical protein
MCEAPDERLCFWERLKAKRFLRVEKSIEVIPRKMWQRNQKFFPQFNKKQNVAMLFTATRSSTAGRISATSALCPE